MWIRAGIAVSIGACGIMTRWIRVIPLALFTLFLAVVAFRWGVSFSELDEGEVIARMADRYVGEVPGAEPADCVGRPGIGRAWIVVSCGPTPYDAARHRVYRVDRLGRLIGGPPGGA